MAEQWRTPCISKWQKRSGDSLCEPDKVDLAKSAPAKAQQKELKFLLPVDTLITNGLDFDAKSIGESKVVGRYLMAGKALISKPKSIELYQNAISGAETILWNGPMGF